MKKKVYDYLGAVSIVKAKALDLHRISKHIS